MNLKKIPSTSAKSEQQKYLQTSSKGIRYHPSIICLCLSLVARSPDAYEQMQYEENNGIGFLIFPSRRRL